MNLSREVEERRGKRSAITLQALVLLATLSLLGLGTPTPAVYPPPIDNRVPSTPTGLTGTVTNEDTSMVLAWTPVSGAQSYLIEQEDLNTGIWAALDLVTNTTYTDTNYWIVNYPDPNAGQFGYTFGGFHYRVSAVNPAGTSSPSLEFPQSRYAVIDLGTNAMPVALNNSASMVLEAFYPNPYGLNTTSFSYWTNGNVTATIPLQTVGGMNNHGEVVGTTNILLYGAEPSGYSTNENIVMNYSAAATWSPSATSASLVGAIPNQHLAAAYIGAIYSTNNGNVDRTYDEPSGPLGQTVEIAQLRGGGLGAVGNIGIADDGHCFGTLGEGYIGGDVGLRIYSSCAYISRLDLETPLDGSTYGSLVSTEFPFLYDTNSPSVNVTGTSSGLDSVNANGVAIGYTQPITTSGLGSQTWVAYDGTTFHNLSGIPYALANNNDILTKSVTGTFSILTNFISTGTILSNCVGGAMNSSHQIVNAYDEFWESNSEYGIADLVPPRSWTTLQGFYINDSGVIAGTGVPLDSIGNPQGDANPIVHGILLVPDKIQRDGNDVNSANNTVCVGQQINLTNIITGIPTNGITYQWNIPGTTSGIAFHDYEPTATNSYYTNLISPTNYLANPYCNFYWSVGGTNQVSCTTVIYGQTNIVSATFTVKSPTTNSIIATTNAAAPVGADTNFYKYQQFATLDPAWLHFGPNTNNLYGISFTQANTSPSGFLGNFHWVQVISAYVVSSVSSSDILVTAHHLPGVDTTYPYDDSPPSPEFVPDSPGTPLDGANKTVSANFAATMYLIWQAQTNSTLGDKTVPVPIRGVTWNWSGTATNPAGWSLVPGSALYPTNLADFPVTNEPTWATNATNYYITSP